MAKCFCGNNGVVTSLRHYNLCLSHIRQMLESAYKENKTKYEEYLYDRFIQSPDRDWYITEYVIESLINTLFFSENEFEYYIPDENKYVSNNVYIVDKVAMYENLFETWKRGKNYNEYRFYCMFYNKFLVSKKEFDRFFKVINKALFGVGEESLTKDEIEDFKDCEFSFEFKENSGWENHMFLSCLRREVYGI